MVDPISAGIAGAGLISPAWEIYKLTQSSSKRLAKSTIKTAGGPLSKRRLRKWLKTEEAAHVLSEPGTNDITVLVPMITKLLANQRLPAVHYSGARLNSYIVEVAVYLRKNYLRAFDASDGTAIADQRAEIRHGELMAHTSPLDPGAFTALPSVVREGLAWLHSTHPIEARQISAALQADDTEFAVTNLLANEPNWLSQLPGAIWAVIGDFAWSHQLEESIERAYQRAIGRGGEDEHRSVLARQALSQPRERARQILEQSSQRDVPLIKAVRAVWVDQEHRVGLRLIDDMELPSASRALSVAGSLRFIALFNIGRFDDALEQAVETTRIFPDRSGGYVSVAHAASAAGDRQPAGSAQRIKYFTTARVAARTALELLADFSGPELDVKQLAARLAIVQHDSDAVFGLTSNTDDRELLLYRAKCFLDIGELDNALAVCRRFPDDRYLAKIAAGLDSIADGSDRETVGVIFHRAFEIAQGDVEQQIAIVMSGKYGHQTPDLNEYAQDSPVAAAIFEAIQASIGNDPQRMAQLVRPHKDASIDAAQLLAQSYAMQTQYDEAVTVMVEAAERFAAPMLVVEAADYLWGEERFEDSENILARGLVIPTDNPAENVALRQRFIQAAVQRRDYEAALRRAEHTLHEHPSDTETGWFLVEALASRNRWDEALSALRQLWLSPTTEHEARVSVLVRGRDEDQHDAVLHALEMAEQYPESEAVVTVAYSVVITGSGTVELDETDYARIRTLIDTYPDRFPDRIQIFTVDLDDPLAVFDDIRERMGDQPELPQEVVKGVLAGVIPLGVLASIRSKPVAEISALAGNYGWPIVSINPGFAEHEQEVRDAIAHGSSPVVLDVTAAITSTQLTNHPLSQYRDVRVASDTLSDIDQAFAALGNATDTGWRLNSDYDLVDQGPLFEKSRELLSEAKKVLQRRAKSFNTRTHDRPAQFTPDEAVDHINLVWMEPIFAALMSGAALLSDDAGLRSLARSMGVVAFGSYALIDAQHREAKLSEDEFNDSCDELAGAFHVDLPFSADQVARLADNDANAARAIISRPRVWAENNKPATELLVHILNIAAAHHDEDQIREWSYAAAIGILRGLKEPISTDVLGRLFFIIHCRPGQPIHIHGNAVLDGFEAACQGQGIENLDAPLQTAARAMIEIASDSEMVELVQPSAVIRSMFSRLTEARQEVVRIAVLLDNP